MKTSTRVQCTETPLFSPFACGLIRRAKAGAVALMILAPTNGVATAEAMAASTGAGFESAYPPLPDLPGPDIKGEAGVLIHLQAGGPLVELEGELHSLEGRPLEVSFGDLDQLTLLFELPAKTRLFVHEQGVWKALESSADGVEYPLTRGSIGTELRFGLATADEEVPGDIELCIRPLRDDPPPK